MKILYIITQADGGGAQKYVLTLAKHFGGTIAAGDEATKLFEDAKKLSIATIPLHHLKREINLYHDLMAIWEIRQLVKNGNFDIVHLNSTKAGILGSFACVGLKTKAAPRTGQQSWTGTRVVFTAHGFRFLEPLSTASKNFYLALEKVASSYRDFIITVSDVDKQAALDNKIIAADKIQTIHNGIEKIAFFSKEQAREKLGMHLKDTTKVIAAISNDYSTKGIDILEKASSQIKSDSLTYVIGHTRQERKVNSYGKFEWHDYEPNASSCLKAFDVFTIPSRKEGLPFVLLEAMQAGMPIVATKVGGIPEALGDAGILVEPENPNALADAITELLNNEQKRKELSQKALERSKLFTQEKMLAETEAVYQKLVK